MNRGRHFFLRTVVARQHSGGSHRPDPSYADWQIDEWRIVENKVMATVAGITYKHPMLSREIQD